MRKNILKMVLCLILLQSCESRTYKDLMGEKKKEVTFSADIKPIIDNHCVSCHYENSDTNIPLTNLEEVKNAIINKGLILQIEMPEGQGMPLGERLPQLQIDLIKEWKNNNFKP